MLFLRYGSLQFFCEIESYNEIEFLESYTHKINLDYVQWNLKNVCNASISFFLNNIKMKLGKTPIFQEQRISVLCDLLSPSVWMICVCVVSAGLQVLSKLLQKTLLPVIKMEIHFHYMFQGNR